MRAGNRRWRWGLAALAAAGVGGPVGSATATAADAAPDGRELFFRAWTPGDPRARGGDGLGPVYNDRSCVACHSQGGPGGGGGVEHNVELASIAFPEAPAPRADRVVPRPLDESWADRKARRSAEEARHGRDRERAEWLPGLADSATFVLHMRGVDPGFESWRRDLFMKPSHGQACATPRFEGATVRRSGRNTPALFGVGLIDAIDESTLTAASRRVDPDFPSISGRVPRTASGRVGRFGWKGQTETLDEFVLAACSNELGLEVPGHHQAADLRQFSGPPAPGLDLSAEECEALTDFVRDLPAPVERPGASLTEVDRIETGRRIFAKIGCASCHRPDLGTVSGIYSDLLLHDLGTGLGSIGGGYGGPSSPTKPDPDPPALAAATEAEWRTPPLWGMRHSGPFLHDGRAATVEAAVMGHGGEAADSATLYANLSRPQKLALRDFLRTLEAPGAR